jgi:hypothetical protein
MMQLLWPDPRGVRGLDRPCHRSGMTQLHTRVILEGIFLELFMVRLGHTKCILFSFYTSDLALKPVICPPFALDHDF